jgi:hypothetical protein
MPVVPNYLQSGGTKQVSLEVKIVFFSGLSSHLAEVAQGAASSPHCFVVKHDDLKQVSAASPWHARLVTLLQVRRYLLLALARS